MALHLTGSDPIFPLAVFMSNAIMISPPDILASVVSSKAQFSASALCHVYNPLSTLVSSLALNHHLYADDTAFPLLPSSRFPLQHQSLTKCSTTDLFLDDCQSSRSQLLKLNFFLLDLNNNFLKYTTALSLQPTPLATLVFIFDEHLLGSNHCTFYIILPVAALAMGLRGSSPPDFAQAPPDFCIK